MKCHWTGLIRALSGSWLAIILLTVGLQHLHAHGQVPLSVKVIQGSSIYQELQGLECLLPSDVTHTHRLFTG